MALNIIELIFAILGIAVIPVLFYRFPRLPESKKYGHFPDVSVIIPARNEEKNLPLILEDLMNQNVKPFEIICVDDDSSDATAQIAESFGVRVISLHYKPEDWTGKTWACQNGANIAKGSVLMFLDADLRLGSNGLLRLINAYTRSKSVISVQPYHRTKKLYEQISLLFNLIQIAANGTALSRQTGIGLYGPIIVISKKDYETIGGHERIKRSVVEDMALGERLKECKIPNQLFVGDEEVSFRMYSGGLRSLVQGWVKNFATGAGKTTRTLFWMVFFWITSMTSAPLHIIILAIKSEPIWLALYCVIYVLWVAILFVLSVKIGHFRKLTIVFYPVLIIALLVIFLVSVLRKIFGMPVTWKGRAIKGEDKA